MPTPITVEQAEALIEDLLASGITKGDLVTRYERLAYPDGNNHRSEEQELALKLYGKVPATKKEIRIAVIKLIRKGVYYEDLLSLLDK